MTNESLIVVTGSLGFNGFSGLTLYGDFAGTFFTTSVSTESEHEQPLRNVGTIKNMFLRVSSNAVTAGSTVFVFRRATTDSGVTVSVGSSATGTFEDTTHTQSVTAGDLCKTKVTMPSTANATCTVVNISYQLDATTDSSTLFNSVDNVGESTASITRFVTLNGNFGASQSTENSVKFRVRKTASIKYFGVKVASNVRTTNTTCATRKNGADGNCTVTFGSSATGTQEDTSHTDSIAAGDDINYRYTHGTGSASITYRWFKSEIVSTANTFPLLSGVNTPITQNISLTRYYHPSGVMAAGITPETNTQMKARFAYTLSELNMLATANTVSASSTLTLRKSGAGGNNTVSITASTAGLYNDTTHTDVLSTSDTIDYEIVTGGSGTALTLDWIGCYASNASLTQVNKTYTHLYKIRSLATQTRTHKYKIIGRVAQTRTHKYKIRSLATASKTHKYKIRSLTTASKTHKYKIIGRVAQTRTHKYKIRQLATQTRTHKYKIRSLTTASKTHKYKIRTLVNTTKTQKYKIRSLVNTTKTFKYKIIGRISKTYIHKYNILLLISKTYTIKYKIVGRISQTFTHIYQILALGAVSRTFHHKYKIRALTTTTKTHKYKIRTLVNTTKTFKYKLRQLTTVSKTFKYNIRQLVTSPTKTFKYKIWILSGQKSFTARYKIRGLVSTTKTFKYKIVAQLLTAIAVFTHRYKIRQLATQTRTHRYNIKKLVTTTKTFRYKIIGRITKAFTHKYQILILSGVRQFTHKYRILNLVSHTFIFKYNIFQTVRQSFRHLYAIIASTPVPLYLRQKVRRPEGVVKKTHAYDRETHSENDSWIRRQADKLLNRKYGGNKRTRYG